MKNVFAYGFAWWMLSGAIWGIVTRKFPYEMSEAQWESWGAAFGLGLAIICYLSYKGKLK